VHLTPLTLSLSFFAICAIASDTDIASSLLKDISDTTKIATQTNQNIDYQPFILSVFQADELMKLGIRTLGEALTLVPGIDTSINTLNNRTPIFRGSNPTAYGQSKLVIDGVVVNDHPLDSYHAYLDFPIELIERIEVVRGSGSFIEGVNGYAGTINVITYAQSSRTNENGSLFGAIGSDHAFSGGAYGRYYGDDWSLNVDLFSQKHDQKTPIEVTDSLGYSGVANLGMKNSGFGFTYERENLILRGRLNEYKSDSAFGTQNLLTEHKGEQNLPSWYLDGRYTFLLAEKFSLTLKSSVLQSSWESNAQDGPSGYPNLLFVDGFWSDIGITGERLIGGAILNYRGLENHHLAVGYTYTSDKAIDMHSITTNRETGIGMVNYTNLTDPSTGLTLAFVDANSAKRLSNEWWISDSIDVTPNLSLALSGGITQTSDIATQHYIRGALVYQSTPVDIFKFMVSNGYRLPSWQELYLTPSPYVTGNPDLDAEKVQSYETQYLHKFSSDLTAGINLF